MKQSVKESVCIIAVITGGRYDTGPLIYGIYYFNSYTGACLLAKNVLSHNNLFLSIYLLLHLHTAF